MQRRIAALAAAAALLVLVAGCGDDSDSGTGGSGDSSPVKIGVAQDLSGPIAPYGEAELNGARLAVDQVNADGGVDGRKVELVEEDLRSDKATFPGAIRKLDGEGVAALVAPTSGSALVVGAPVVEQSQVPLVAPSASTGALPNELNEWTFRVAPLEKPIFGDLLSQVQDELGGFKRLAIFYDPANNASINEVEELKKHASEMGYEIVATESSPEGSTDVSGPVSKIAAANPDAIFVSHLVPESAAFMKQIRARNVDAPFFGGAPFATPNIFEIAGDAGEGALTWVPFLPNEDDPQVEKFVADYQKEHNKVPDQFGAQGYDATLVVLEAIRQAGSTDRSAIRDAIAKLQDVDGVTGTIAYDGGPDNVKPRLVVVRVKDGKFEAVE